MMTSLFDPLKLGSTPLANRVAMAPMTRARRPDLIPDAETARYYRQRASAGLIITEGIPVSTEAQGYIHVPGLWTDEQAAGWRGVTDAVHAAGGHIFAQLWHVGRMSHTSLQDEGGAPVGPSARPARDQTSKAFTILEDGTAGFVDTSVPRALETEEVSRVAGDFAEAAARAGAAGFDGIEIHAAHGYLFEQFLDPHVNDRTDRYGGSVENRARFLLETVDAVIERLGGDRVGVRLSPFSQVMDTRPYPEERESLLYIVTELSRRGIAYIHLSDPTPSGERIMTEEVLGSVREIFGGALIVAGKMDQSHAESLLGKGLLDMAAFGRPYIANPDLVERLRNGWPPATPDRATFYGGGSEGYTDYPTFEASRG